MDPVEAYAKRPTEEDIVTKEEGMRPTEEGAPCKQRVDGDGHGAAAAEPPPPPGGAGYGRGDDGTHGVICAGTGNPIPMVRGGMPRRLRDATAGLGLPRP